MEEKERQANYELLRIIAMGMVITLHYLGKGGFLTQLSEKFTAPDYAAWLLEAFCVGAVDIYVLISGYFLVDAVFSLKKAGRLWRQIFFYSAGVPLALVLLGLLPTGEVSLDRAVTWLLPVLREHYWFATSYMLLYLLSPLLGRAARTMEKKELFAATGALLLLCSVGKSVLPFNLPLDTGGYDVLWFICLYLTAACIRLYGLGPLEGKWKGLFGYIACTLSVFGLAMGYRLIYQKTGRLGDFYTSPYQYNHILCLLGAVCLFSFFRGLSIKNGAAAGLIRRAAGCTFGVYLLHENEAVRYLWPAWLGAKGLHGSMAFLLGWLAAVAAVFAAGTAVEAARRQGGLWLKLRGNRK